MTEDEAYKRWCPYSRVYDSSGSFNRGNTAGYITGGSRCLGAECMAWRWVKDELIDFVANGKTIPDYKSEHGYCGLAGKL